MDRSSAIPADAAGRVTLGDLTVHRIGYGSMRLCADYAWGMPRDRDYAHRLLRRALDLGIDFIDTADSYGPGVSEALIAEALYPYPRGVVIGTKGGYMRTQPSMWKPNGQPEHLRAALEGSLARLKLECIDLYQFHIPDPSVPFEESVGALAGLRSAGKIRHVGLSSVSVAQLEAARKIVPIVSVQNHYHFDARSDDDVVRACERLGIAFIPWYPLGAGQSLRTAKIKRVAARLGATPAQVALAWQLARSPIMLPIPGTGSIEHLEENAHAAQVQLSVEDRLSLGIG